MSQGLAPAAPADAAGAEPASAAALNACPRATKAGEPLIHLS